eukprot:c14647_g1_i1 orf=14-1201(+)
MHTMASGIFNRMFYASLQVFNDELFAILVLMCLVTTFLTTPIVMALYKPRRTPESYVNKTLDSCGMKDELRILACIYGARNVPGMVNLLEATRGIGKHMMKAYVLHLVEMSERPSALHRASRSSKNDRTSDKDHILMPFEIYGQISKANVQTITAMSELGDMHEDVCKTATENQIAVIVLPFHDEPAGDHEMIDSRYDTVNERVLLHAPCTVAIFVDRNLGRESDKPFSSSTYSLTVAILFFGGPDDREALAYGYRLAEHPGVTVTVFRFLPTTDKKRVTIDVASSEAYRLSMGKDEVEKQWLLDEESLARAVKQQKRDPDVVKESSGALTKERPDYLDSFRSVSSRSSFLPDCLYPVDQEETESSRNKLIRSNILYEKHAIDTSMEEASKGVGH